MAMLERSKWGLQGHRLLQRRNGFPNVRRSLRTILKTIKRMKTIEGLENDFLRSEIKRLKEIREDQEQMLVEDIYQWIMSNEDMGMGECADALYEATKIVAEWKRKIK